MKVKAALVITLSLVFILANFAGLCVSALQEGFYRGKCGVADVELIVAGVVTTRFFMDPTIVAALIRLQFHDCFVNGCDASILIDGSNSEKTAQQNHRLRGYDIIDEAKAIVEKICPGVVSCADLIAIAVRDAVFLGGGGRYNVQTGRRDGLVSLAQNVSLLGPLASVSQSIKLFAKKGLSATDMVILLGAHSVGVTRCSSIKHRLYNYKKTGKPDPTIDPFLANLLRSICPRNSTVDNIVSLDQMPLGPLILDNSYYKQLMVNRGILQIDQELATKPCTRKVVRKLATSFDFPAQFRAAMVKLGAIEVLTGKQGEVRRHCRAKNKPLSS
ncbi:hypothetical protein SLE2022_370250 [Rubroshorea leprosula]